MEEQDDHGLNLALTLKPPANHHHHNHPTSLLLVKPPPPSTYLPSNHFPLMPSPYNRPLNDRPLTGPSPFFKSLYADKQKERAANMEEKRRQAAKEKEEREWERINKEIVASIEEKRRREAEEVEEREWEKQRERKQKRPEVGGEVVVVVAAALSPNSTVSTTSLSGNKRGEREESYEAEKDMSSKYIVISDDEDSGGGDAAASRKKLMLSKDQAAVLEETFKENNSLSAKQKLDLAKQLDLRPRQVEVWFQNRRARTKLKQTEVHYDYLKTCCEIIGEENRRMKKELAELRAFQHFHQSCQNVFPLVTLVMCPQCRITTPSTSSSAQASSAVAGVIDPNHQNLVGPKSTSNVPFTKLISSEALNVPRPLPSQSANPKQG